MRDFLEFLKRPGASFPVFAPILALLVFGYFTLNSRLSWFEVNAETRGFWKSKDKAGLFVPSPLETYLLDTRETLWPDLFNTKNPLRVADVPTLYRDVARQAHWDVISPFELEEARQWSVLANSGHYDELRSVLKKPTSGSIRAEKECSPLMQETLYRISQAWPEFLKDIRVYFAGCAPHGVHLLWWELQAALERKDPDALKAVGQNFQIKMNDFPGQWSRWFGLEAYQIAHVMASRFQEEATAGTKPEEP